MKEKNHTRKVTKNKSFEIPLNYNLNEYIFSDKTNENEQETTVPKEPDNVPDKEQQSQTETTE